MHMQGVSQEDSAQGELSGTSYNHFEAFDLK